MERGHLKIARQAKIIELIHQYDIETQEELADRLLAAGYNVTQATVSRDIRELKLSKISIDGMKQKYIVLKTPEADMYIKYVQILKSGFISMDKAQNILVVKTISGMAMAVAASLDALNLNGIVGCIAGDDTVMCAIRESSQVEVVMEKISKLLQE